MKRTSRIRGRKSQVLEGGTFGGTLTIRLPSQLHYRLALHCRDKHTSINRELVDMLTSYLEDKGVEDEASNQEKGLRSEV